MAAFLGGVFYTTELCEDYLFHIPSNLLIHLWTFDLSVEVPKKNLLLIVFSILVYLLVGFAVQLVSGDAIEIPFFSSVWASSARRWRPTVGIFSIGSPLVSILVRPQSCRNTAASLIVYIEYTTCSSSIPGKRQRSRDMLALSNQHYEINIYVLNGNTLYILRVSICAPEEQPWGFCQYIQPGRLKPR